MRCSKSCYLHDLELVNLFDNAVIEQVYHRNTLIAIPFFKNFSSGGALPLPVANANREREACAVFYSVVFDKQDVFQADIEVQADFIKRRKRNAAVERPAQGCK